MRQFFGLALASMDKGTKCWSLLPHFSFRWHFEQRDCSLPPLYAY